MENSKKRRWMDYSRSSKVYEDGVKDLLDHIFREKHDGETISCPCKNCVLYYQVNRATAYDHLVADSIMPSYDTLFCHDESLNRSTSTKGNNDRQEALRGDNMRGMIHDVFGSFTQFMDDNISEREEIEPNVEENTPHPSRNQPHPEVDKFEQLIKDSNKELYPGCKKFSKLSFVLQLYYIKLLFKWSNESFNALLGLLKDALPEGEKLPPPFYESKKIVEGLGLSYKKIHACPNDCMLFRNEFAKQEVNECLICGASRWKNNVKKVPAKVLRHFPLKPRLQRLFMS